MLLQWQLIRNKLFFGIPARKQGAIRPLVYRENITTTYR